MEGLEEHFEVLDIEVEKIKKMPYSRLKQFMGAANSSIYDIKSKKGMEFEINIESLWLDSPGGAIRVNIAVFDKEWQSLVPVVDSFIKTPDGRIVEEKPQEADS